MVKNIIIIAIFALNYSCTSRVLSTSAQWITDRYVRVWETPSNDSIVVIDDGKIPDGYSIVAVASFESGPITVRCDERYMINEAMMFCRKLHAHAMIVFDVKRPTLSNTCFSGKILILKKNY